MNRLLTIVDSKYQRLEYLESTGTQWIDTGISKDLTHTYRLKGVVNFQDVTNRQLIGAQGATYFGVVNGYFQITQASTGHTTLTAPLNTDIDFDITFDLPHNKYSYTINGTTATNVGSDFPFTDVGKFYLFNIGDNLSFPCKCKLKPTQIYDNDVLVRNFVPVLRKTDNELGMLDLVEGKFYPNAGTGKFTANLDTMYAIIQGNLTNNNGVISGFVNTGENYLKVNNINSLALADSWEIVVKLNNVSGSYVFGSNLERIITVSLTTGKLYLSSNGSSWDIAGGVGSGSVPANSYIRVKFTGTQYTFDHSSDKVNWTNHATVTSSTKITSLLSYLKIGAWWEGSSYTTNFSGTINSDKSSIKINSTKYNLQAVVGYTIVGSPTITDGVVSGFNSTASGGASNDYITLPNFTLNADDDFEFVCRGNYERVSYSQYFFYSQHFGIYHSDTNTLQFIVVDSGGANKYLNGNFTPSGDFVYVRITKVGNRYTTFASNDGKIWTQLNTSTTITPATTRTSTNNRFGTSSGGYSLFTGEIDLNNTYIKINNKLWFNGQPS